ncbi:severin [Thecamonas trahens ATCC 50062]|uniref:Severin n=1 Tax=Thecamonas trahens ATCC 50062 TaxID=461836 RepID=A0A0L0DY16_THETB|nr:severin [Thecamonas trahens ATCC 50062]KNC56438.1 severin [Thecamonas trahens ATCC 50062]|eukprot:XP_013760950.1 severin [Thecamonas trahens ATCC 50062]
MSSFFNKLSAKLSEASKTIQQKIHHRAAGPVGQADLEDSNVANIGSAEDRAARKAAAETEPAWEGAGAAPGIEIWRIEKFEVKKIDAADHGKFYGGDSYIILLTTENEDGTLKWDIHFWLGAETSVDEMGTAAYKTVELDNLLDDAAVQHREVQDHESSSFLAAFNPAIQVLAGGIDSGFRHVEPESYTPRLLHVKKVGKNTRVSQVALEAASLNQHDVFVLDAGLTLYQFEGEMASAFEKHKAAEVVAAIRSDRDGQPEMGEPLSPEFWELLGGEAEISTEDHAPSDPAPEPSLWKLTDDSGELTFDKVADAPLSTDMLESDDVFILDTGIEVFIWIGEGASYGERYNAMPHAMEYLTNQNRPSYLPITRLVQGGETQAFNKCFE